MVERYRSTTTVTDQLNRCIQIQQQNIQKDKNNRGKLE